MFDPVLVPTSNVLASTGKPARANEPPMGFLNFRLDGIGRRTHVCRRELPSVPVYGHEVRGLPPRDSRHHPGFREKHVAPRLQTVLAVGASIELSAFPAPLIPEIHRE